MDLVNILIVVTAVLLILVMWIIVGVRHLRHMKESTKDGWEELDEKLRHRHDLVPNLVETIRVFNDQQERLLGKLIKQRSEAAREYSASGKKIEKEHDLSSTIDQVIDLGRIYKDLSLDTNFLEIRREIDDLEAEIEKESEKFNKVVRGYNKATKSVALRPLSALLKLKPENIFEFEK